MKSHSALLIAALIVAGLWGTDSLVTAQSDCVSQGAVSPGEPALAADCEVLLDVRRVLLGTATLGRAADIPTDDWDEFKYTPEEAAFAADPSFDDWDEFKYTLEEAAPRSIAEDPPFEAKHYYVRPPSLNWAADVPIEDWEGIAVDGAPRRVVGISLDYERLPGTIPKELGDLSSLKWLHLDRNELSGPVPSELGSLSNLTSLRLDSNRLRGAIPAELGSLSNLEKLYLDRNRLTGEIPRSFTNLTNLTDFRFSANEGLCAPTDESFRAWLRAIESVAGSACDFAADRAVLVKFFDSTDGQNWQRNYGWLSDQPMGEWYGVFTDTEGRVTKLYLGENGLSGQLPLELGDLSNLYWLILAENQLSGPLPSELGGLYNLEGLFLGQNLLSGPVPSELGNLSKLRSLHLGGNQLGGHIPSDLGGLPRLSDLGLGDNQLSGEIPPELGDLSQLERLLLGDNQLSGEIPSELGGLPRLNSLDLGDNQLSGEIPSELGDLSRLTSLHLSENLLTGEFPESFTGMPLRSLDFHSNPTLCAPIDDEFQSWLEGIDTVRGSSCAPVDSRGDKAVLALLYNATDGENWDDNSNWLSDLPIREWYGVTSDADGRVTGLYLSDNQLSGSIPPEMGDLSQLQWLYLQQNKLTGQVPRSFFNLANLTNFYFSDNAGLCAPVDDEFQTWLQGLRGADGGACNPVADLNALTRLYNATDGVNWYDNSNWLSDRPMGEWHGVETDDEGHVTVLNLEWNRLLGTIPPELGSLSNLEELNLGNNHFTGTIPLELSGLHNLEELDLGGNWLTGTIPPELSRLANLTSLSLADNELTGSIPPELSGLSDLEELDLWKNQLTGSIPRELGSLTSLTSLWLTDNLLTGSIPIVLGDLSNLENLGLSDNQLTGETPPVLGDLSNLDYLGLGDNQLTGAIPTELGSLTNLTWLRLWNNQLTGSIPRSFTGLTNLTRLEFWNNAGLCAPSDEVFQAWLQGIDIVFGEACDFAPDRDVLVRLYNAMDGDNWEDSSNWLTDQPMGDWHGVHTDNSGRVRWLNLSDNQLTGEIPPELRKLSNLVWLNLSGNQLTGEIPTQLSDLANLEDLDLSDNQLTGEIPTQLSDLANLEDLDLSDNQLIGEIPSELGNLSDLTWLSLQENQLTGEIPPRLGNLSNLDWLALSDNQLNGQIPSELGNLSTLGYLYLYNNQLSGSVPSELGGLTNLWVLRIDRNQLTGEIPANFTGLTNLALLSFYNNPGLCASVDESFQKWLQGIDTVLGSSCAPVDSQADRAVLVKLYDATDGANWKDSSNWLSDRPVREWHGVTNDADGRVTGLYLRENGLSGPIPPELGDLSNLRRLSLHENQLTGSIPPELGSLTNLISLNLSDNQLTGSIPPELGNLSNLELLSLSDNQLTGSIPPELGNLSNLTGLYLSDNQLTGCIPAPLERLFFFNELRRLGLPICGVPVGAMSIDSASYRVRIGSPVPVTATFSEPVYGFTESDIDVTNGSAGNFTGSDGESVFTFDVIPSAVGVVTVDIGARVAESYEGNGNTAAELLTLGIPYDDDHDGAISRPEVITAITDYLFGGLISRDEMIQVINLFLFG